MPLLKSEASCWTQIELTGLREGIVENKSKNYPPALSEMTLLHTSCKAWGEQVPQSCFLNLENVQEKKYWGGGRKYALAHCPSGTWAIGNSTGLCVGGGQFGDVWGGKAG